MVVIEYCSRDGRIGGGEIFENVAKSSDKFASCVGCSNFSLACATQDFIFALNLPRDGTAHVGDDGAMERSTFIDGDGFGEGRSGRVL